MSLEKEFGYKKLVGIGEDGMFYIKSEDPDILEKTPLGKLVGERIIKFLVDQVSDFKDKKVIDIGSGSGGISLAFAKRTKHVTATDISKVGLKFVEKSKVTGEYYITSLIDIAIKHNEKIETMRVGKMAWRGVNTKEELMEAEKLYLKLVE